MLQTETKQYNKLVGIVKGYCNTNFNSVSRSIAATWYSVDGATQKQKERAVVMMDHDHYCTILCFLWLALESISLLYRHTWTMAQCSRLKHLRAWR